MGVAHFFLDQSIGIDETNTFQLKFFIKHEDCGRHRFGRFVGIDENNTFQLKFLF